MERERERERERESERERERKEKKDDSLGCIREELKPYLCRALAKVLVMLTGVYV